LRSLQNERDSPEYQGNTSNNNFILANNGNGKVHADMKSVILEESHISNRTKQGIPGSKSGMIFDHFLNRSER